MTKQKILIVEDSKPILQIHSHIVTSAGFEPVTAETLAEVKSLQTELSEFFLAIIDYSLPDATHGEAIPYLLNKKVPSVVMTGMLDDKTRDSILKQPVIDYITKENQQAYTYLQHLITKLTTNHQIKILIVDSSNNSLNYLNNLLERHRYQVIKANCGQEALYILEKHPDIKLVITEKELSKINGFQLCNQIRAKHSKDEISIIGISGIDNSALTAKFIKSGANDYIKKPFCPEEFYCRVIQNLEHIESIATIKRQAHSDYLTGVSNRRHFFESTAPIIKSRAKKNLCSTLAMLDIDFFKSINDNYGHEVGDEVLKATASLMAKHFSSDYTVARVGGEEFVIFLDQLDLTKAITLLNAFREDLSKMKIQIEDETISCTISIGVSHRCEPHLDGLMNQADEQLYNAKKEGRNIVVS